MSIQVNCDVCFETKPLASVRVLPSCGHAFCVTCIEDIAKNSRGDPPCPNCRVPFKPAEALQAFLQGSSIAAPQSASTVLSQKEEDDTDVERLAGHVHQTFKKLDAKSSQDDLEAVIEDLLVLSGCMISSNSARDDAIQACLFGISQFMERISPMFTSNTRLSHVEVSRLGPGPQVLSSGATTPDVARGIALPLRTNPSGSQQRSTQRTDPQVQQSRVNVTVTRATCFIKNVTSSVPERRLRAVLTQRFGPIKELEIHRPKACAFLEFTTVEAARKAVIASLPVAQGGDGGIRIGNGSRHDGDFAPCVYIESFKERSERHPSSPGSASAVVNRDQRDNLNHHRGSPGPRREHDGWIRV